tara:strand:+ start:974 stop:1399 length:426 start_codon:yes stop_codon:yes gene_type:complete
VFSIEKPKEIHLQSWKNMVLESLSSHNFTDNNFNFDRLWTALFQDNYYAFSAKNENKFMGIIISRVNETFFQRIMELDILYVLPDYRKIGVARALINKVETIAKEQNLDLVIRGVEKSNLIAQKLFKNYLEINRSRFVKKA